MEILTAKHCRFSLPQPAMRRTHAKYAQLGVVNTRGQTYLLNISEFLISNVTFHTPSLLECHKGNHPTAPLSQSMCGRRDDQESTKSQIAFMRSGFFFSRLIASFLLLATSQAHAENVTIATASNFAHTLKQLSTDFSQQTGHTVNIIQGSSGALATQIIHGLPVDIFLSADQARIDKLIEAGVATQENRFTYAIGQLTLWSADQNLIPKSANQSDIAKLLSSTKIRQVAIANPKLAPYGLAAHQTIRALKVSTALHGKIIHPQNIALTFTSIAKGGIQLGLIARAQALNPVYENTGSHWHIPAKFHQPIKQDGIILKSAKNQKAAHTFVAYLKSNKAVIILKAKGYRAP